MDLLVMIGLLFLTLPKTAPVTYPRFLASLPPQMEGIEGGLVELPCRVEGKGNRTVSWVKLLPMVEILAAGRYTFTSDPR